MTVWRSLALIFAVALPGWSGPMDLAPPSATSSLELFLSDGMGDDRGVLVQVASSQQIGGAGIRFDPLAGGLTALRFSIFSVTSGSGGFTLGGVLASADAAVVDAGLAFYDVPLSFLLNAGSYYYLAFSDPAGVGWGKNKNQMELFDFDAATSAPYTAGTLSVIDGGAFPQVGLFGFGNLMMPHVQLLEPGAIAGGPITTSVPEPATWAMLGAAYLLSRARSSAAILASTSRWRRSV